MDEKLTYKDSGVDVESGYETVKLIKGYVEKSAGTKGRNVPDNRSS
jgi:phosphoribosylformylglycinamidine cyclo-ligase